MQFEWDENKALRNEKKHKVSLFVLSVPERQTSRRNSNMKTNLEQDTLRSEYDFSTAVRGKHHKLL